MKQRRMFVGDSRVKPGNDRIFLVLLILLPLLFTSCLAEFLNEKFGFNASDPNDPKNLSKVHIYEYYFLDYDEGIISFDKGVYKQADIVSISNTSFKPVEEYHNCQLIAEHKIDNSYENYYYEGKIYEKALVTELYYYNPEVSLENFTNMINWLPILGASYTWYVKIKNPSSAYINSFPYDGETVDRMINLDLTDWAPTTSLSGGVFQNKKWLREISFNLQGTGAETFMGCINLERVDLGSNLTSIGNYAFKDCIKLQEIKIPKVTGMQTVNQEAFSGCWSLKSVFFPSGFKKIVSKAFEGCTSLEAIYLPVSISEIETEAFSQVSMDNCTVYYQGSTDKEDPEDVRYKFENEEIRFFNWMGNQDCWQ